MLMHSTALPALTKSCAMPGSVSFKQMTSGALVGSDSPNRRICRRTPRSASSHRLYRRGTARLARHACDKVKAFCPAPMLRQWTT
jgi:hypothetical protein